MGCDCMTQEEKTKLSEIREEMNKQAQKLEDVDDLIFKNEPVKAHSER